MKGGLLLDMANKNALITNAMLTVYIDEKNMDYTRMLMPFIEASIYDLDYSVGDKLEINNIKEKANSEYGLDLKDKVVEKILYKMYKNKNGGIVKYSINSKIKTYTLNRVPDVSKFKKVKEGMANTVKTVITEFVNFYNNEHVLRKIDYYKAQSIFAEFLNKYNFEIYDDINATNNITIDENAASDMYYVARYIIAEYDKKEKHLENNYNNLLIFQQGYFAQNAIYYFMNGEIDETPSQKLNNVYFILDTRILIDVLELNYDIDSKSMSELLDLIKKNGAHLCTYDYYVDELKGIIDKFILDRNARINLDLAKFRENKTGDTEMRIYNLNIVSKLSEKNVSILNRQEYDELIEKQNWHIDYASLEYDMLQNIEYQAKSADIGFINDIGTLHEISYLRNMYQTNKNDKLYVFVSSNLDLVRVADRLMKREKYNKENFGLAISDIDLTTLLWLYNYNSKSNLPSLTLLENAYAAIVPTKRIVNKVIDIINTNSKSNDQVIKGNALFLRYDPYLLQSIADVTKNNSDNISQQTIEDLTNHVKKEIRKELIPEIRRKIMKESYDEIRATQEQVVKQEMDEKQSRLDNRQKELDDREQQLNQNVFNQKQETNRIQQENSEMRQKVYRAEKERDDLASSINNIRNQEFAKFNKRASKISKGFMWFLRIVSFAAIGYAIYIIVSNSIMSVNTAIDIQTNLVNNIGTIATYIGFPVLIIGISNKIQIAIYNHLYHMMVKKSEILNTLNNKQDTP